MDDNDQRPIGVRWPFVMYQQIAGVIGAFVLVGFFSNILDWNLPQAFRNLVGVWDTVVRPPVALILTRTGLSQSLYDLSSQTEISQQTIQDYLTLGIVLFGGSFQAARAQAIREGNSLREFWRELVTRYPLRVLVMFAVSLTLWPVIVLAALLSVVTGSDVRLFGITFERGRWVETLYMLSALTWFVVLAIGNYINPTS